MRNIFLFTDYRGQFYSSTKGRGIGADLMRLRNYFTELGFKLITMSFREINFRNQNYKNEWILYQSSEDPGLFYKSYIDDIIAGLLMQGANLLPNYYQFKAHHNKHFMEIMRDSLSLVEVKNIKSERYGTYEDYLKDLEKFRDKIYVLKVSHTSKSRGVFLLQDLKAKIKLPEILSRTFTTQNLRYFVEKWKTGKVPLYISNHRQKFILQPYVSGLLGDYRVLIYGEKFYILYRKNRPSDFRASGSMRFNHDIQLPEGLLDYAKKIFDGLDVPYLALDIGAKDGIFYLFEFQFVSFGQYTLEKSKYYYWLEGGKWKKKLEEPDLEREITTSVANFIEKH